MAGTNTISKALFNNFFGQIVEVVGKSGEEQVTVIGYLLDADEDYFYFGANEKTISTCLKRTIIDLMALSPGIPEEHELMTKIDKPKNNKDIN